MCIRDRFETKPKIVLKAWEYLDHDTEKTNGHLRILYDEVRKDSKLRSHFPKKQKDTTSTLVKEVNQDLEKFGIREKDNKNYRSVQKDPKKCFRRETKQNGKDFVGKRMRKSEPENTDEVEKNPRKWNHSP